jgi:hypothetical protein
MKEAVRPPAEAPKIAVAVEDDEGVVVFEDVARTRLRPLPNVERRLGNQI